MGKLLVSKSGFELQEIELEHGSVCIGRAKDNDIQLNDATVSSHHAKIVTVMSTSYIQDLGSTNGIFVNGDPVVVQALHADDVISIGNHEILFQQSNANQSSQDEDAYDTQLVNSMAGSGSSSTHQTPAAPDKAFTDFRETINYSDLRQPNPGLRVVVDNTSGPAKQHTLDIDIDLEKFSGSVPKEDHASGAKKENQISEAEKPYTETRPYVEIPSIADSKSDGDMDAEKDIPSVSSTTEQRLQQETIKPEDTVVNDDVVPSVKKPVATTKIKSRQPFVSSEEVVEQLIVMGRNKAKRSKKFGGLSSVLGVVTFILIAVSIYFQLK